MEYFSTIRPDLVVVATLPPNRQLAALAGMTLILALSAFFWFWFIWPDPAAYFSESRYGIGIAIGSIVFFSLMPVLFRAHGRLFAENGRQIWIENDVLVFYGALKFPCRQISNLSLTADDWGYPVMCIDLHDGSQKKIHVNGQSPSPEIILERLRKFCGLPGGVTAGGPTSS